MHLGKPVKNVAQAGFTLIEALIVLVMIGVLATVAGQSYTTYFSRAKRVEARIALSAVWDQQQNYKIRFGKYASTFDDLGFAMAGGTRISATTITGKQYEYRISQPWGEQSWYCSATGNLDADDWLDVLVAEQGVPE